MSMAHYQSTSWSWANTYSNINTQYKWGPDKDGVYTLTATIDLTTVNSVDANSIFQTVSYNMPSWGAGPFRINNYEPGIQQACGGDAQCMQSMRADMAEEHFELVALAAGGEVGIVAKAAWEARVAKALADSFKAGNKGGTEIVQRWMSKSELKATKETGLLRGGREGTHYVTDSANSNALRARQRSALPQTPEVRVTLEVPKAVFSKPSRVEPAFNMPGGVWSVRLLEIFR